MMSGTKLKNCFKKTHQMSITEYIQRKRMAIAENLLLTTQLDIVDVAKSVGYNSHSRFSALFKRYRGIYPKEVRHFASKKQPIICPCNEEARECCQLLQAKDCRHKNHICGIKETHTESLEEFTANILADIARKSRTDKVE